MRIWLALFVLAQSAVEGQAGRAEVAAIADYTSYNIGDVVRVRLQPATKATVSIRYSGEVSPLAAQIPVSGAEYVSVWKIPAHARTGRYQVDLTTGSGTAVPAAASFAVHRQLIKIMSVDLDKTFYTSGDSVSPTITLRNVSDQPLSNLQVEFEPYTYPWIAPDPDEPPMWKRIVDSSLSLAPGAQRKYYVEKAAVLQVDNQPEGVYYSVVVRDSRNPEHIYDLAFALPAITIPPNRPLPKQYPFLYLYWHASGVAKSEAYRAFYPPEFVSSIIQFDTSHTIFPAEATPSIAFSVKLEDSQKGAYLRARVLDAAGKEVENRKISGLPRGTHTATLAKRKLGRYLLQISLEDHIGSVLARNQIEFAVDKLPKAILVFCAHQDDDTAHPGIIRAAVENHIPIHVVYLTGGDAGGCDRFYMHSCDAARAMDFGEVRMEEARSSLGHLGIPRENILFLGLPDGGLGQIWEETRIDRPYLSVLLASDHSPYREAVVPNLAYARQPVVTAVKEFIQRFHPDLIVTGHPDERHVDHRVNNWLVVKAMQDLLREGTLARSTELLVDRVYGQWAGKHAPYHFEKRTFFVPGEVAKLGQEARWYYQSQDGNQQQGNILNLTQLPREEPYPHFQIINWQDHEGWNEGASSAPNQ